MSDKLPVLADLLRKSRDQELFDKYRQDAIDPYGAEHPKATEIKNTINQWLEDKVATRSNGRFPNVDAALATIPSVMMEVLLPSSVADVAGVGKLGRADKVGKPYAKKALSFVEKEISYLSKKLKNITDDYGRPPGGVNSLQAYRVGSEKEGAEIVERLTELNSKKENISRTALGLPDPETMIRSGDTAPPVMLPKKTNQIIEDRIKALEATIGYKKGDRNVIGSGIDAIVYDAGDKVVKTSPFNNDTVKRGFLDSILEGHGLAPKTHVVELDSGRKYMVQDKADKIGRNISISDPYSYMDRANELKTKIKNQGISVNDAHSGNVGEFGNELKLIDTGNESLHRYMTPEEHTKALEKFVSNKRDKPWLNDQFKPREDLQALSDRLYDIEKERKILDKARRAANDLDTKMVSVDKSIALEIETDSLRKKIKEITEDWEIPGLGKPQ